MTESQGGTSLALQLGLLGKWISTRLLPQNELLMWPNFGPTWSVYVCACVYFHVGVHELPCQCVTSVGNWLIMCIQVCACVQGLLWACRVAVNEAEDESANCDPCKGQTHKDTLSLYVYMWLATGTCHTHHNANTGTYALTNNTQVSVLF